MAGRIVDLTSLPAADRTTNLLEVSTGGTGSYKATPNFLLGFSGGNPVSTSDTQTLTNKTLTAPTLSSPILSGTVTGTYTLAGTPTFPATVVSTTGTQTLTNKTLTSPVLNTPTLTNASISADAITGFTTSNSGTIYGVAVSGGLIAGSSVTNIPATSLGTGAITLGYAQITSNFNTTSTSAIQVTGLSATVTIPAGGRRVKITAFASDAFVTGSTSIGCQLTIWDGTVGSGTQLSRAIGGYVSGSYAPGVVTMAVVTPAAGTKTYNIGLHAQTAGTSNIEANPVYPAFILVEAI